MKARHIKILVGTALIIVCLIIGYSALSDFTRYYRTIAEVTGDPLYYSTHEVNMIGTIVNNSFSQTGTLEYAFTINDSTASVGIIHRGSLPQTFNQEGTVVVTGRMNGSVFESSDIQVKCPTKYEPE
ncbi:MAG: cytochrome c maturation protein CcmE [Methanosarcinales archaeon]|nr:cytochrome c maturation protein CcmE [ANME-2 cluster archaeon]MDW7775776.1 cytochrome c maturation protein CcmE [Methanosarcinales archaeon]